MFLVQIPPQAENRLVLTDQFIRGLFPMNALEAGRIYEMRGRVNDLRVSADGLNITARTQGSAPEPYAQAVTFRPKKHGGFSVASRCSCPVGGACKHVAAMLIAAQHRQGSPPVSSTATAPHAVEPDAVEPTLPFQLQTWLAGLECARREESEDYPIDVRKRLIYVLSASASTEAVPTLSIQPLTVALRKDGSFGQCTALTRYSLNSAPRHLRPSDRMILKRIFNPLPYEKDDDPVGTLRRIIATGRAFWGDLHGKTVREAPARQGELDWAVAPDGSQQPVVHLPSGLLAIRVPDPWYANPATGEIGPVSFDLPSGFVSRLLQAPPIPAELAPRVRREFASRLPTLAVPQPRNLPKPEPVPGPPKPHLRLMDATLPRDPFPGRSSARRVGNGLFGLPLARISFEYGAFLLPFGGENGSRIIVRDGRTFKPQRDPRAEGAILDRLLALGFGRVSSLVPVPYRHAHSDDFALLEGQAGINWMNLVTREVPRLRAEGWTVEVGDDFPLQVITTDSGFNGELIEGTGIDWLELHLGVQVGEERIDLIPALVRFIVRPEAAALLEAQQDDEPFVLTLDDGRLLSLPTDRIRPTLEALLELHAGGVIDPGSGRIGFHRLDAAELARLEDASGATWQGGEAIRALGRQLREAGGAIPEASVPDSFKGALRPYQAQGVNWLQFLRGADLGGILADDMGLGKTVQTLAHLVIEQAQGRLTHPALIVCPTSLVPNWMMETARFAPSLKVLPLHGPNRRERFREIPAHDLVLTTYPLLTRDHEVLTAQDWHAVILDEAQTIKNPDAETTHQALRLKGHQRVCLSGTPLQNHLGELWSLFDFIAPGFLGNQRFFKARYRTPIEKHGDAAAQARLARRVRPFLLRRTKDEVVRELPPKTEITEPIEMQPAQRAIYESIRLAMHSRVRSAIAAKGLARSGIIILDALLKMRQACCDPRLLKLKAAERAKAGSAKLDRLMDMLGVMRAEGRRILLFSQFTEMLALIERRVEEAGIDHVLLTGDTRDRASPVKRFQSGEVPLFLISLKAGGVGLNLTAADTVIHYDPWWNPATEDQATDRAHRIGQTRAVFVHRMVTIGTIEEKMEHLKEKKRALVASVLEAEQGGPLKLTEADVEALFGQDA
jgi:superfamily II DNA or RNA helicase